MVQKKLKKAEASVDSSLKWILYLALLVAGALALRMVFARLSA